MSDIGPIETCYDGYRFRSRLEARWAVFFNYYREQYEYEKEGYKLPSGWYLPDFWLPNLQCWLEVKGQKPTDHEVRLMEELAHATRHPVIQTWSLPYHLCSVYCSCVKRDNSWNYCWNMVDWMTHDYNKGLALCNRDCDTFIADMGKPHETLPKHTILKGLPRLQNHVNADKFQDWLSIWEPHGYPSGMTAAKSARFE